MAGRKTLVYPRRGEVYLVRFDPTLGAEIKKTRPALILQNDVANRWSPITIVAAITSRSEKSVYPTEVRVSPPEGGLTAESTVLLNQVRSIDKRRLIKRLGILGAITMGRVDRALQVSVGLAGI